VTGIPDAVVQFLYYVLLVDGTFCLGHFRFAIEACVEKESTRQQGFGSPTGHLAERQLAPAVVWVARHTFAGFIEVVGNQFHDFLALALFGGNLCFFHRLRGFFNDWDIVERQHQVVVIVSAHKEQLPFSLVACLFVRNVVYHGQGGVGAGNCLVGVCPQVLHLVGLGIHQVVKALPPGVAYSGTAKHVVRHDVCHGEILFKVVALKRTVEG